jgi:multiple sugar transport system permease protein
MSLRPTTLSTPEPKTPLKQNSSAARRRWQVGRFDDKVLPYLLWAPTLVFLLFLVVYPTVTLFINSFYRINPMSIAGNRFVGLSNYIEALANPEFYAVLGRTVIFVAFALGLELAIGIGLALLVFNHIRRGQTAYKILLIFPMMVTPVAVGLVWRWMFDGTMGIINYMLGLFGITGPLWLGGAVTALAAVIVVEVWQWTPFVFLGFFAGLSALPNEPFEAARVDGANAWQIFTRITLPIMGPVLSIILVFRLIDVIKTFDVIYVLTEGGPGQATEILPFHIYQQAFRYFNVGYASALSWLMLLAVVPIYSFLLRRISQDND